MKAMLSLSFANGKTPFENFCPFCGSKIKHGKKLKHEHIKRNNRP